MQDVHLGVMVLMTSVNLSYAHCYYIGYFYPMNN